MTTAPAHRPSLRQQALDSTLALARTGASISLDSAARAAGLTKPGLMYHFPTKVALMAAVVDHLIDAYERGLAARLPQREQSSSADRVRAYLDWTCAGEFDTADLMMFTDPRLRETLTDQWVARIEPWLQIATDLAPGIRANLLAARLIADGIWFAAASGGVPLTTEERDLARSVAIHLIEGTP